MPCYYPVDAWRSNKVNPDTGKRGIVFTPRDGFTDMAVKLPCGRCIGCRLEYSRQWALRCTHEASLHEDNCFITLTYDDDHMPADWSLDKKVFQDFMKRFRKAIAPTKIRFYMCGEYGSQSPDGINHLGRPHFHALIFGYDFPDKTLHSRSVDESPLFTSELLSRLWTFGYSMIGAVTFESAGYVARYTTKKIRGDMAEEHYTRIDPVTGEYIRLEPEFGLMSRRPGIAADWYAIYKDDLQKDFVTINHGQKNRPPRFYDYLMEKEDSLAFQKLKARRARRLEDFSEELTLNRLRVKEKIKVKQTQRLKRGYEHES